MKEWCDILINNGIAVAVVVYFCYMNYKFTATINESLVVMKELLRELQTMISELMEGVKSD